MVVSGDGAPHGDADIAAVAALMSEASRASVFVARGTLRAVKDPNGEADPVLGAGRARRYLVTDTGWAELDALGVNFEAAGRRPLTRRPLTRYCIDWSEQRPHLAGALGAAPSSGSSHFAGSSEATDGW